MDNNVVNDSDIETTNNAKTVSTNALSSAMNIFTTTYNASLIHIGNGSPLAYDQSIFKVSCSQNVLLQPEK